jgi:hypothetical protein
MVAGFLDGGESIEKSSSIGDSRSTTGISELQNRLSFQPNEALA